ncbi:MAG: hypothetical protein MK135_09305 [Polyangiaceae bacterium]|nr:hypothetical protein [Polyangiaceae bacterium]
MQFLTSRSRNRHLAFSLFLFALAPRDAFADEEHNISLTISLPHLVLTIGELTGEVKLPVNLSVAAIAAYGRFTGLSIWEVGAQGRYYLLGDFDHGMSLGVEALYMSVGGWEDSFFGSEASGGVFVGPFIGYKIATDLGFTFDSALGIQYVTGTGQAMAFPLINANIGWSF